MAKIFISYKYGDSKVLPVSGIFETKVRDYVDILQALLEKENHINKGEKDDESLEGFKDETISSKLRDKIYDSSVTLVLISKNMKEPRDEKEQWIPWEISYSLMEPNRGGRISKTNAIIAVIVPDENGSYEHFINENSCPDCNAGVLQIQNLFNIISKNMLNKKQPVTIDCNRHLLGTKPHIGDHSYIYYVKWTDFVSEISTHLNKALEINKNIADYVIQKDL